MAEGKISEFFMHLLAYGGMSYRDGIIYVWNDPALFIPSSSFAVFQKKIIDSLGEDAKDILYWIGNLNGKNASIILIKKYGFDSSKLDDFLKGGSLDGWGYAEMLKYPQEGKPVDLLVKCTNSTMVEEYQRMFPNIKSNVDFYFAGLLNGGGTILFKCDTITEEDECKNNGKKLCIFHVKQTNSLLAPKIFKKFKIDNVQIEKASYDLYSKRFGHFKILGGRNFKFGDGKFYHNNIQGMIIQNYIVVIMDYILLKVLKNKYIEILDEVMANNIKYLNINKVESLSKDVISKSLNLIQVFGYGKYEFNLVSKNKIIIMNNTSYYPKDYMILFSRSKEPVDIRTMAILKNLFNALSGKKVSIIEKKCMAMGHSSCIYEITL